MSEFIAILHKQKDFCVNTVVRILNCSEVLFYWFIFRQKKKVLCKPGTDLFAPVSAVLQTQDNRQRLSPDICVYVMQARQRQSTNQQELHSHFLSLPNRLLPPQRNAKHLSLAEQKSSHTEQTFEMKKWYLFMASLLDFISVFIF